MISKNNITRAAKTLKQLISLCETYGEFDKKGNLNLLVEKIEHSYITISKEQLKEYESKGMSTIELHQKLKAESRTCEWKDSSLDIQIPKPKLRTKIFYGAPKE
jgi:hypothetical protein